MEFPSSFSNLSSKPSGEDTWNIWSTSTKKDEKKLEAITMWWYRRMYRMSWGQKKRRNQMKKTTFKDIGAKRQLLKGIQRGWLSWLVPILHMKVFYQEHLRARSRGHKEEDIQEITTSYMPVKTLGFRFIISFSHKNTIIANRLIS